MASSIDNEYHDLMSSGKKLYKSKKYSDSIKFFKKAIKVDEKRPVSFLWLAKSLIKLRKFDESLYYNDILLTVSPNHHTGWLQRINLFTHMYNFSEVVICCDKAFKISKFESSFAQISEYKINALLKLNKILDAKKIVKESLKKFPNNVNILAVSASVFERLEEFDLAVSLYTSAIKIQPNNWKFWYNRGINLLHLNNNKSRINFKKATILNPKNEKCWLMLGSVSLSDLHYAIECFDKSIAINSKYVRAYENKGRALELLGRLDESRQCYALAMDISGRNDDFV